MANNKFIYIVRYNDGSKTNHNIYREALAFFNIYANMSVEISRVDNNTGINETIKTR